jgi:hypothetical protein
MRPTVGRRGVIEGPCLAAGVLESRDCQSLILQDVKRALTYLSLRCAPLLRGSMLGAANLMLEMSILCPICKQTPD